MEGQRALLPKTITPSHYSIHLTPNFTDFTFKGSETVSIKVNSATDSITLHAKELKITSATFVSGDVKLAAKEPTFDTTLESATLPFESSLPLGEATLQIEFEGVLNTELAGFYRSKYIVKGEERYMAVTQFEPTDARRAFPSWDEPAIKATFQIILTVPKHHLALSNMPQVSETEAGPDTKTLTFDTTPIMSTYLVAFVVGEFDFVEGKTKEGVAVRVYTPLGKSDQGKFALDVGVKTLSYYTEYFGIGYPLPKSDMIAIPDFAAGAMENWGLITYRETALLIDEANSSVSQKQRVAYVVAHELAHQWFGNLVTMEWWKELWLNEGFATFVGNQAVDYLYPNWNIWTQFISQYSARALELDALKNSHPIEVEVYSSAQVNEIFDAISYCKGASVIRMVANYLGEAAFQKGLNIYLNRHKYANAVTEDLWAALSESSGKNVKEFMDNWTKKTGYPVLSLEQSPEGKLHAHQHLFLSSGDKAEGEEPVWWLSVGLVSSNSSTPEYVDFKEKEGDLDVASLKGASWFKANATQSGFFRVKYSPELVTNLVSALKSSSLSEVDRLGLQNDAFALAKAGLLPTEQALEIAEAYRDENEYTILADISGNLGAVGTVWASEPNYDNFKAYNRHLFSPIVERVGWDKKEGEPDNTAMLRAVVIGKAGGSGDEKVIEEAKRRFADFVKGDTKSLVADLRFTVYSLVIKNGGTEEYEAVLNIYKTADLHEEKIRALRALGLAKDPALTKRTLEFGLSPDVRSQDVFYVIASTASFPEGRQATWDFLRANWATFDSKFGEGGFLLPRIISLTCSDFNSEEKAAEVEQFFKEHPCPAADRTIKQALESIRAGAKWLSRDREGVAKWLAQHHSN